MFAIDISILVKVAELAIKHGPKFVDTVIKTWKSDEPITAESIEAAEQKFKDPASYFEPKPVNE